MKSPSWRSSILAPALAVSVLAAPGCVPYQVYEQVKKERDQLKTTTDDLAQRYNRAIQDLIRFQKDGASNEVLKEQVASLNKLNKDLRAQLEQFSRGAPFQEKDLPAVAREGGVKVEPDGSIGIGEQILFNPGEATLKGATAREVLDSLVDLFQRDRPNEVLHISGHTDTDPLKVTLARWKHQHNLAYNRAYTVFTYFLEKGIPENRMVIHAFAYLKPVDTNDTKEGKARNRRVTISMGGTRI